MEQTKAQLAAGVLADVLTGDIGGAYAKLAPAVDTDVVQAQAYLSKFVDRVAEAMEIAGGRMNEITVNGWVQLNQLGDKRLADIVLGVAIERAREVNRNKVKIGGDEAKDPYAYTRSIKDNPQA